MELLRKLKPGTWIAFVIFAVVTLLPFYWIILSAITPRDELFKLPIRYWPEHPTLDNFAKLLDAIPFWRYFFNSTVMSLSSAFLSVLVSFLAAYAFSRFKLRGSGALLLFFLITTALPPVSTLLPLYDLFASVKLLNTLAGLILLVSSMIVPFTVWILVSFVNQVPKELDEAAIIDGCSRLTLIFRIVAPICMPALATMFLINFVTAWNELLIPLVFASDASAKTLSVGITELAVQANAMAKPWELISAIGVAMIIPVMLLVFIFQRAIVSGLSQGAVK
jgi:ABC-type glycerol-3-phosphate transport system permease component